MEEKKEKLSPFHGLKKGRSPIADHTTEGVRNGAVRDRWSHFRRAFPPIECVRLHAEFRIESETGIPLVR